MKSLFGLIRRALKPTIYGSIERFCEVLKNSGVGMEDGCFFNGEPFLISKYNSSISGTEITFESSLNRSREKVVIFNRAHNYVIYDGYTGINSYQRNF